MKPRIQIERIPGPLATSYEKASRMVIDSYYRKVAVEIVAHGKTGRMLDLGCGPGYLPLEIVKLSTDISIVGIDLCKNLIQTARVNAAAAGLTDRLQFEVGDAAKVRFEHASFDMVLSTGMLHSLKDPIKVFREVYRLLKKGGTAWIYDPANVSSIIDKAKWRASLIARERFFLALYKFLGLYRPVQPYAKDQVLPLIKGAGFKNYDLEAEAGEIKIILRK